MKRHADVFEAKCQDDFLMSLTIRLLNRIPNKAETSCLARFKRVSI